MPPMNYRHVCVESLSYTLPPLVVTSADIEERLARVYECLHLPAGRLELMTGIAERRFFPTGTRPGQISGQTALRAVENSGIDRNHFGALVHGSVCRDQMEPATANIVHHTAGLPDDACILDVSNACLGLLNGVLLVANMIEQGQIEAGVVVGTEIGRPLVDGTIDRLLTDETVTRKSIKDDFASLTIGSGSAAIVLCHQDISQYGTRLLGGSYLSNTAAHQLCAGGVDENHDGNRLSMATDSEALLHAGIDLAKRTWPRFLEATRWTCESIQKVFTHQVGKAHRQLLLDSLEIPREKDFPTVEFLGNTGAVALPMAMALGFEKNHVSNKEHVALLGIGSGLNCLMLGLNYNGCAISGN